MNIKETNRDFWERQHRKEVLSTLSGCSYEETITGLWVTNRITPSSKILEVGIGIGHTIRGLSEVCKVSALDISKLALKKVEGYCEFTYTLEQIESMPTAYFDIILCVNVVQHIPTELLKEELAQFIRSLKIGGIFAVQFVTPKVKKRDIVMYTISEQGYGRSLPFMISLLESYGTDVKVVSIGHSGVGPIEKSVVVHAERVR